jgi:hypothetical protein
LFVNAQLPNRVSLLQPWLSIMRGFKSCRNCVVSTPRSHTYRSSSLHVGFLAHLPPSQCGGIIDHLALPGSQVRDLHLSVFRGNLLSCTQSNHLVRCRENVLLAIKICIAGSPDNEASVSRHLNFVDAGGHPGKDVLRLALDDFDISAPSGIHQCLVFKPLGLTFTKLRNIYPERGISKARLQHTLQLLALGLHFMHSADVIHTGI